MEPTLIFGAIGAVMSIGSVGVWAVRTEGRINTLKAVVDERDEKLEKRLERMDNNIKEIHTFLLTQNKS